MDKLSKNNDLKSYFEQIFKLNKSGKKFPVDLDSVWPLVYSEKGKAVRALKENFIEGVDYSLDQNGKQNKGRGGQNKITYKLSVQCLEFFVARKVKEVFEVYREVFHKAIEQFEPTKSINDHAVKQIQVTNSKHVNAFIWQSGGVDDIAKYNRQNCINHTGHSPSEWKDEGKRLKMPSKLRTSGKEVVRHLMPEAACSMSLNDDLVKQGIPVDKATEVAKKFKEPFKALISTGYQPRELIS